MSDPAPAPVPTPDKKKKDPKTAQTNEEKLKNMAAKAEIGPHMPALVAYIDSLSIRNEEQLLAATKFLNEQKYSATFDRAAFERVCGVGISYTDEQINTAIQEAFAAHRDEIMERRYNYPVGLLFKEVSDKLAWVDRKKVNALLMPAVAALLGPRTEADNAKPEKPKKPAASPAPAATATETAAATPAASAAATPAAEEESGVCALYGPPGLPEDVFPAPLVNDQNPPEIYARHLAARPANIVCRFPPEPNGFLHIGHAKACFLDFGMAQQKGGLCYFRLDDTNPKGETQEYIDSIAGSIAWLGHHPWKVTYTSDYFDKLHELAVVLIKKGLAYVDHSTKEEISAQRENKICSRYRDRPVEENLKLFEDMRKGKFGNGECVLRMKMDMNSPNPCMRDLIAYRVIHSPHPRTGDKWCIYPSYDFSHCIVDSLENVTHSMCTLEFEIRRDSYFWLLEVLGLYKPIVWEMSRLNVTHAVISKRKVIFLVQHGMVAGWSDPRLATLEALRRRGYTPEILHNFIRRVGITRNENLIKYELLEHCARQWLDTNARRAMAVLDPIKVTITNVPEDYCEMREVPDFPKNPERGSHRVPFTRQLYIDRSDWRDADEKSFFGLAPGKETGLKNAFNFTCTEAIRDGDRVVEIRGTIDPANTHKCKGHLTWVSATQNVPAECRLYDHLFMHEDPNEVEDWLGDMNPNSLQVCPRAFVDVSVRDSKPEERFQFERLGYFCTDRDSTPARMVFNRTTGLKEAKEKATPAPAPAPAKKH
ncbi:putative Glutamine--tRNA ligase [Paratrimastix pyriformis]|uniref:glutamine--tRNA ligase n=1 Tax=Paratrimastix pyriformis TaxID=342808 RepID=A0ABQ8URK0_9EUKA|nr:putative Glutamine--tRNA ligase [Paratrimastix pyriformis]|eukprot:GAFH01000913.1.p1 GENE.GAFH01000913.1~~GAFH01000913.1.p1  ORF type:complete len:774 (+),score=380.98 GAFH01000913.1:28-2322(+)